MWVKNGKPRDKTTLTGIFKSVSWGEETKQRAKRAVSGQKKLIWEDFEKGYRPSELRGKYPELKKRTFIVYFYQWNNMKWGKTDDSKKN